MQCHTHNYRTTSYCYIISLALAVISACSCDDVAISKTCPLPRACIIVDGEVKTINAKWKKHDVGQCRQGFTRCNDDLELQCDQFVGTSSETCDGIDNNCDGVIDEDFDADGDTYTTCAGDCDDDEISVHPNHRELCDGVDNDCDGVVDEEIRAIPCFTGGSDIDLDVTPCKKGAYTCQQGRWTVCEGEVIPTEEICDGVDNDCNGTIDERTVDANDHCGAQTELGSCKYGREICIDGEFICYGSVLPTTEACDGYDNDCDGDTDEELYRPCSSVCGQGFETCGDGVWEDCSAAQPSIEICDEIDNDCDGDTDEGCNCVQGQTTTCQSGALMCGVGISVCDAQGVWGPCTFLAPEPEICDNWDNDCDGTIDGFSQTCGDPTRAGTGACQLGTSTCTAGMWTACAGAINPEPEICDGLDNDCDGLIDEDLNPHNKVDMVFAIDTSGSMCGVIGAVAQGIAGYVSTFSGTDHRFALVEFPPSSGGPYRTLTVPALADVTAFSNTISALGCVGGGHEPSYDVMAALAGSSDLVGIGWRSDAYPYIVLITDEPAQSWTGMNEMSVTAITQNCQIGSCQPGDHPEIYLITPAVYWPAWDDVVFQESDRLVDLRPINAARYTSVLNQIFEDVCR